MSAVYTATQTNFTGADADNGLLNPALHQNPGGPGTLVKKQVWRIKLIAFANPGGSAATVSFLAVNPETGNEFEIDGGTVDPGQTAVYGGPMGFAELPVAPDGTPWLLKCVSSGAAADCEFSASYDLDTTGTEQPEAPTP